jgi:hypothetical protein
MLSDVMRAMGDALVAMTREEVDELFDDIDLGDGPVLTSFTGAVKKAFAVIRKEGRKLSADTANTLKDALDNHDAALGHIKEGVKCFKAASEMIKALMEPGNGADGDNEDNGTTPPDNSADDNAKSHEMLRCKAALVALGKPAA